MWGLYSCTPSYCYCTRQYGYITMHSSALRGSMCCNGVHDAYDVFMQDTVTLSCVCPMVSLLMRFGQHTVIGSRLDRPHCIVLWICSVYCMAV